jgi:mechanosensitive ion channel protein 4/5/6/7/8/9/10
MQQTVANSTAVHQSLCTLCRERRNIANTLEDTRAVLSTLELLVGCVLHAGAFASYLAIFGVDVGHLLISMSSVAIAFAFVFGNSLRTVYESVVFLFIVHPYQVGDRCAHHELGNASCM